MTIIIRFNNMIKSAKEWLHMMIMMILIQYDDYNAYGKNDDFDNFDGFDDFDDFDDFDVVELDCISSSWGANVESSFESIFSGTFLNFSWKLRKQLIALQLMLMMITISMINFVLICDCDDGNADIYWMYWATRIFDIYCLRIAGIRKYQSLLRILKPITHSGLQREFNRKKAANFRKLILWRTKTKLQEIHNQQSLIWLRWLYLNNCKRLHIQYLMMIIDQVYKCK